METGRTTVKYAGFFTEFLAPWNPISRLDLQREEETHIIPLISNIFRPKVLKISNPLCCYMRHDPLINNTGAAIAEFVRFGGEVK